VQQLVDADPGVVVGEVEAAEGLDRAADGHERAAPGASLAELAASADGFDRAVGRLTGREPGPPINAVAQLASVHQANAVIAYCAQPTCATIAKYKPAASSPLEAIQSSRRSIVSLSRYGISSGREFGGLAHTCQ